MVILPKGAGADRAPDDHEMPRAAPDREDDDLIRA
jgi:hypothetical protein